MTSKTSSLKTFRHKVHVPWMAAAAVAVVSLLGLSDASFLAHSPLGTTGMVRHLVVALNGPVWLISVILLRGLDDYSVGSWFLFHFVWACGAFLQWKLLVALPEWLRARPAARVSLRIVAFLIIAVGALGVAKGLANPSGEHGWWWDIRFAVYVAAMGVVALACVWLSRPLPVRPGSV